MRKIILGFILSLLAVCANAVPAKRGITQVLTLANGTTVTAQLVGDEHGHYWLAADGKAYQAIEGTDVYRQVDARQVMLSAREKRVKANAQRSRKMAQRRVGEVGSYIGEKRGLVILVNFSDVSFKETNNNELYQRITNEENFNYSNFKGSVHDYFLAQSEEQFSLNFDVVGPVTVSRPQSYYGANNSRGDDKYPATMVIEALELADEDVNFADYDWDNDGEVEQVYVIYAGKGEADGGASSTIWPHEWQLSSASYYGDGTGAQTLDGVTIDTYACGSELNGSGRIAGIGTMCHEFSHCLGYPDFYDTDYSGGQGMGSWSLMDEGSYNGDGYQPAGFTSYERWMAGWKTPIELKTTLEVTGMKSLQEGGESYVIYNEGNRNEFFLLENRQKTGWDASLPGVGLLILHVDYDADVWAANEPNDDPSHQRMTWIPADNEYNYYYYSDPYPHNNNDCFNRTSTPAAKFYNKNTDGTYFMSGSVENITQSSGSDKSISFLFVGEAVDVSKPVFSPKAGVYTEAQQVTITCETEGATIYYTTDGSTPTADSTPYTEPFMVETTTLIKAIAILDNGESEVATARYVIRQGTASDVTTFKLVNTLDEMVSGQRYVIVCGNKQKAVGALNIDAKNPYFYPVSVTVEDDVVTITDEVMVFFADGFGAEWTFMNDEGQFLYATDIKRMAFSEDEQTWTLANDDTNDNAVGVGMTFGDFGTLLYNSGSPRFTTYTSTPTKVMIVAHLYMECEAPQETGIIGVARQETPTHGYVYDLQGRRVTSTILPKGIYIVDGKKVVIP
ncbi:MAG: M6 family metalloprotease domain-containing protein [Prevotella sp.]|nr:M6 family metalloprotease domain-containing protein [Prevotella sp.]